MAAEGETFVIGNLTETDVANIAASFELVEARTDEFATMFYTHLFEIAPVRHMFKETPAKQGRKLIAMLKTAIKFIRNPETLIPTLQTMAVRHIAYGTEVDHYQYVGQNLIWTLNELLGSDFTPATREAWTKVYTIMADVCIKAHLEHLEKVAAASAAVEAPASTA